MPCLYTGWTIPKFSSMDYDDGDDDDDVFRFFGYGFTHSTSPGNYLFAV